MDGLRRLHALDDLLDFFLRFFDGLARGEREPHAPVTREVVGAGQDEIAHAGEAHEGFLPGAERDAEPHELDEPAVDQGNTGIRTEAETVGHAGADGQGVLHGSADLDADDVVGGVGTELGARDGLGQLAGKRLVG